MILYDSRMGELMDVMRNAIKASNKTCYRIAKDTGIAPSQLSRLMSGERGLSTETLECLTNYLGLEIVIRPKRRHKGK
jgi:transcriptional regulator with XRE-family HTH domain